MRNILFPLLFLLVPFFSFSQVSFGVKAGPHISQIHGSDDLYSFFDRKISYHVGGLLQLQLGKTFAIQPELLYADRGATSEDIFNGTLTTHFHSIQLPVMVQFYPIKSLAIEAGPEVGYIFSATITSKGSDAKADRYWTKKANAGLNVGMNYNITQAINLGMRYHHGITGLTDSIQLTDSTGSLISEDGNYYSRVLQLSIAYLLMK